MSDQPKTPRKLTRREMLRLAALTGVGLVATQCAPATNAPAANRPAAAAPSAAPAAAAAAGGKVPLRLVVMDYDEKMKPDTQAMVDGFNKSQSQAEAKLDVYSWDQGHNTLLTQISGNQAPDLANGNAQWLGEWSGINEVQPLDGVLPKEFLANFVPSGLKAFTVKGSLMALPYFLDPRALYYRKDLFEQAGLKPPQTWDDVIAAAQKLHNPPDMTGYGMTFSRKSDDMDYWWYAWLGANGAGKNLSIWDEKGKSRFNTPEAIAATQFLVDLAQKYKVTNADIATAGRDDGLQPLFYAGKLAMLITGSWFPTLLKNNAPNLSYGIASIPVAKPDMTPVTAFWPDCVMMFKQSKHQAEAAQLLQYMFNKENRLLFAQQRGVIPERKDVGADPAYAVSDTEKFFVKSLDTAYNAYETPFPNNLYKIYTQAETLVGRAVTGEISAEDAMKQAAEFADKTNGV
jgi:multiple sugar transport system substrate-binding protein